MLRRALVVEAKEDIPGISGQAHTGAAFGKNGILEELWHALLPLLVCAQGTDEIVNGRVRGAVGMIGIENRVEGVLREVGPQGLEGGDSCSGVLGPGLGAGQGVQGPGLRVRAG